jgi:phytoene synthase
MPDRDGLRAEAAPERRGTPAGSLRYYAVLFASPAARPLLHACYALEAELRETAVSANHDISHTRLQWWRDELAQLNEGQPRHPVTRALAPAIAARPADLGLLRDLVVAAEFDLAHCTYDDWLELEAYCGRAGGALQEVIAAAAAAPQPLSSSERDFAGRLGRAVRQAEMLRDFAHDLRNGWLYLPTTILAGAGLDPRGVQARPDHPALAGLLAEWRGRVYAELLALPGLLDAEKRRRQTHGIVLGALHRRLLENLAARRGAASRVELAPVARLWTAWRAAVSTQRLKDSAP